MCELKVYRVENGLGNACALLFPDKTLGVVDWGTQADEPLVSLLDETAPERVRFVAATHAHADHTLGIKKLLAGCVDRGIAVDRLVYPTSTRRPTGADYLFEAREYAFSQGIAMTPVGVSDFSSSGGSRHVPTLAAGEGWDIRVLAPPSERSGREEVAAHKQDRAAGNLTSLVLMYRTHGLDGAAGNVLLPGDATPETLRYAAQNARREPGLTMDHDMLVVPHHGSQKNLPAWLDRHIKGSAVISAPANSLHHPAQQVLERLGALCAPRDGAQVFCTSYARHCRQSFGPPAAGADQSPLCFGHMTFSIAHDGTRFGRSTHNGEDMRSFGICGNCGG